MQEKRIPTGVNSSSHEVKMGEVRSDIEQKSELPQEIVEIAEEARNDLLPEKSRKNYESHYASFVQWKEKNSITGTNETVLLAYFKNLTKNYKPTTFWSQHSMLKTMISLKERVNIDNFSEVTAYLKKQSHGYI